MPVQRSQWNGSGSPTNGGWNPTDGSWDPTSSGLPNPDEFTKLIVGDWTSFKIVHIKLLHAATVGFGELQMGVSSMLPRWILNLAMTLTSPLTLTFTLTLDLDLDP